MDVLASINHFITSSISQWGYVAIFFLMTLSSMCIPVSSEVVLLFGGFLAYQAQLNVIAVIIWGTLGNLAGSIIAYYIGLYGGRPLFLKWGKYFFVKEKELDWAEKWFARYGHETVFFGRMIPIVRAFISVPAGVAEMNFAKFSIYTLLGALPWDIALVLGGYYLGTKWDSITPYFRSATNIILLALVIVIVAYVLYHIKVRRPRSRQQEQND